MFEEINMGLGALVVEALEIG